MKKIKIVLATLIVAALGLGISSFTVNSYNSNAFARVCFKLEANSLGNPTTIEVVVLNDQNNNTAQLAIFQDVGKWESVSAGDPPTPCNGANYVCAICFDPPTGFTLQEALDGIAAKIENGSFNYGHDNSVVVVDGTNNITIDVYQRTTEPN